MVATVEENELIRKLFEPEKLEVKTPTDWAAIVYMLVKKLPLGSMRGFRSPDDVNDLDFLVEIHEMTGHGWSTIGEFKVVFCDGMSEKKHVSFCFFLRQKETPRKLLLEYLCMDRGGNFYIVESSWEIRKDHGYKPDSGYSDRACHLRKLTFRPTDVESLCEQYMFAMSRYRDDPLRSVGLAICYKLFNSLRETARELDFQLNDAMSGIRSVRAMLERIDPNYSS